MKKSSSATPSNPKWVLPYQTQNLTDLYTLGKILGQGQFGTTYLCTEKSTGHNFACKSIPKRKLLCKEDYEDVWREIQMMHHLSEHPHVVRIRGTYEDPGSVHLVMDLCKGGELFDRIVKKGHYSEREAAKLIKTIVGVVEACHSLGVMHRDLKPENFLFDSDEEDSALKATDFGLSVFYKPGEIFSDVVGSPYYVAPEVLCKHYGPESDVWSAGVILYILLSGVPPFWAETETGIFRQILQSRLDFESQPWPGISNSAKDLIAKMLERNPRKRITAHQVICHPWIIDDTIAPDKPLDSAVLSRLKQFSAMNKLKKMALRVIAERLSEEEIGGLKELFKMIDADDSGSITFEELKEGLSCDKLTCLPDGLAASSQSCSFTRLKRLAIGAFCSELDAFPAFQAIPQLESLWIAGWPKLKSLPEQIQHLPSLRHLKIETFRGVEDIPEWLGNLASLEHLTICCCESLEYLPSVEAMQRLTKLKEIRIVYSPLLEERCREESGPEWPKIRHLPFIQIGDIRIEN